MITFGYKSKLTGPLKALAALIIGIMMVVNPDNAFAWHLRSRIVFHTHFPLFVLSYVPYIYIIL